MRKSNGDPNFVNKESLTKKIWKQTEMDMKTVGTHLNSFFFFFDLIDDKLFKTLFRTESFT